MIQPPSLQIPGSSSKRTQAVDVISWFGACKFLSFACCFVCVIGPLACINQTATPIKKSPPGEKPAAPKPTGTPDFSQFPSDRVYVALKKTYLKSKAIDSAKLFDAEKCAIEAATQIVLREPPGIPVNKHWRVDLQASLADCKLESGYLFTEHWKQSSGTAGATGDTPCGHFGEFDFETGRQLAREAERISIGSFTGRCYEFTGIAIENMGLMPKGAAAWAAAGVPVTSAADFVEVENSSKAANFVRFRPSSWSCLPEGTIVVWNRGVCGFNKVHGHIEVVVSQNTTVPSQTRLCSDGCQTLQTSCSISSGVSFFYPRKR